MSYRGGATSYATYRWCTICLTALLVAGCCGHRLPCSGSTKPFTTDTLFFGSSSPQGAVTPDQWQSFVDEVVAPRFPAGFTTWSAQGQWQGEDGRVREESRVLFLVHGDASKDEAALQQIMERYKKIHHQESVLRVTSEVCASF